jgi:hypothetical protein
LKCFEYQVIPANVAEPIRRGTAMMPEQPSTDILRQAAEPHLDNARLQRVKVLVDGERRDMFIDDLAIPKGLPRNKRATAIYHREAYTSKHPDADPESLCYIAGPVVLFDELVWF